MNRHADVVVIGGGISGTAAAYELARAGAKVTLVEQSALASMASGWTLAGVRQSGRDAPEIPLAMAAVACWATLGEELGADLEYRRGGNLRLVLNEEQIQPTIDKVAEERALGLELSYLPDNQAVRQIAPAIAEWVPGASFCPSDGHANPVAAVNAFAAAAERLGAAILTGTAVHEIDASGGVARGVRTSAGAISADEIVVTAGVHSGRLCAPLGAAIPFDIYRVGVIQTVPLPPLIEPVLGTAGADFAGRQEVGGRFRFTDYGSRWPHGIEELAGGYEIVLPSARAVQAALTSATAVLPALAEARVARVWGGLLDVTPDALPVIERVPEIAGLTVAAGFSGHGFCLGPITGQIVRDLVMDRETSFPIGPFRRDRFVAAHAAGPATLRG